MYMWAARLITGHAGGAAVTGGGLSAPLLPPASGAAADVFLHGPSLAISAEYHHFIVPGGRTSPVVSTYMPSLAPWLLCAVRRAHRPPGAPSCAALSLGWTAAFLSQPANVPDVKAAMGRV